MVRGSISCLKEGDYRGLLKQGAERERDCAEEGQCTREETQIRVAFQGHVLPELRHSGRGWRDSHPSDVKQSLRPVDR